MTENASRNGRGRRSPFLLVRSRQKGSDGPILVPSVAKVSLNVVPNVPGVLSTVQLFLLFFGNAPKMGDREDPCPKTCT